MIPFSIRSPRDKKENEDIIQGRRNASGRRNTGLGFFPVQRLQEEAWKPGKSPDIPFHPPEG